MRCKKCERVCKHPRTVSWRDFQICPDCFNKPIREII